MNKLDAIQGTATAALATTVITPPTSSEWKQLGLAALSAIIVAAVNVLMGWLRGRMPIDTNTGDAG